MQACRLQSHTVDVTPPQATTNVMVETVKWWEWRTEWLNGGNGGPAGMGERQKEWQNGRNWIQTHTYVLFMVHTVDDDTF